MNWEGTERQGFELGFLCTAPVSVFIQLIDLFSLNRYPMKTLNLEGERTGGFL